MDATLILIDSDAELLHSWSTSARARWNSNDPADVARLEAQARLVAAYEEMKWPRRPPSVADLLRHLMDQHGLTRADLIPLLGTPSRVSEVMRGKKGLSMAMVQRLRARFRVPADLLLPPPKKSPPRRSTKRAAALTAGASPRWNGLRSLDVLQQLPRLSDQRLNLLPLFDRAPRKQAMLERVSVLFRRAQSRHATMHPTANRIWLIARVSAS